jgi:hypothetical protein
MRAGLLTFQQEITSDHLAVHQRPLRPELRYLLVQNNDQEALMVWVGNEPSPVGEASVWVSSDGVVMRLSEGRLIGISEPRRYWRLVAESARTQTTDEQPGLRLGLERTIEKTAVPNSNLPKSWRDMSPDMQGTEEIDRVSGKRLTLYAAHPASEVMAGQRCITPAWCLRWQTWPTTKATTPAT